MTRVPAVDVVAPLFTSLRPQLLHALWERPHGAVSPRPSDVCMGTTLEGGKEGEEVLTSVYMDRISKGKSDCH